MLEVLQVHKEILVQEEFKDLLDHEEKKEKLEKPEIQAILVLLD